MSCRVRNVAQACPTPMLTPEHVRRLLADPDLADEEIEAIRQQAWEIASIIWEACLAGAQQSSPQGVAKQLERFTNSVPADHELKEQPK